MHVQNNYRCEGTRSEWALGLGFSHRTLISINNTKLSSVYSKDQRISMSSQKVARLKYGRLA